MLLFSIIAFSGQIVVKCAGYAITLKKAATLERVGIQINPKYCNTENRSPKCFYRSPFQNKLFNTDNHTTLTVEGVVMTGGAGCRHCSVQYL